MPKQATSGIDLHAPQTDRQCEGLRRPSVKTLGMTNSCRVLGFSLIETLFVLLVLAILCGTAVFSFQSLQVRAQVQAASQALLSDVLSARTEALRRERRVTLCAAALDTGTRATLPTACAPSAGASAWHHFRSGACMLSMASMQCEAQRHMQFRCRAPSQADAP